MNILIVGGDFNTENGRPSKIITTISNIFKQVYTTNVMNGGNYTELKNINFTKYDVVFWSPNIPNNEDKLISSIKQTNPKLLLISTKRVVEKEYKESDIIGRLLQSKSNLGIMITKDNLYNFKLLDPLGNCYSDTTNIPTAHDFGHYVPTITDTNFGW